MARLTESQIERYSRQIIFSEVGGKGQEKLLVVKARRYLERTGITVEPVVGDIVE